MEQQEDGQRLRARIVQLSTANSSSNGGTNDMIVYSTQYDREMLLLSLTEKTGGEVLVASTVNDVLNANQGKRLQVGTKRKFVFQVGPGLAVDARYILLMRKLSQETLKTGAIICYDTNTDTNNNIDHPYRKNSTNDSIDNDNEVGLGNTTSSRRSLYNYNNYNENSSTSVNRNIKHEEFDIEQRSSCSGNTVQQIKTEKIESITQYVDAETNPDTVIDPENITTAIRYGSSLIPMSSFDFAGLHSVYTTAATNDSDDDDASNNNNNNGGIMQNNEPRMEILGYMERNKVLSVYIQGPPYSISGNESQKSCAVISALAQALHNVQKVAIVIFFKTKNSTEPILGTLMPYQMMITDSTTTTTTATSSISIKDDKIHTLPSYPMHLVFLQIPFAGDVKKLTMVSIEEEFFNNYDMNNDNEVTARQSKMKSCDQLIDSLLLPTTVLESGTVPSPFVRSWNQTKMKRAINNTNTNNNASTADVVNVRTVDDPMATPSIILTKAIPAINSFQQLFPLRLRKSQQKQQRQQQQLATEHQSQHSSSKRLTGRKVVTYKDYL